MNKKLKTARQNKGLTQAELAKKTNITTRNYQYYENGGRTPNAQTAILIANALGTTVEALWSETGVSK